MGEVSFRGEWRAGTHEPIIERELFDAAQAILDTRAASPAVRRSNPADYLFSTLSIVCDRCGHPMVGASAHVEAASVIRTTPVSTEPEEDLQVAIRSGCQRTS